MARFEKSRQKSAKPHAAVAPRRATTAPSIEDTMFFPRLRRHAKWMFVLLALIFGGFVLFGVGAGGVGVGDVFRDSGGTSGQSVSDARGATEDRPNDPDAWLELSTALQTEGDTAEAIAALDRAIALRPKDADTYRQLAGFTSHAPRSASRTGSWRRRSPRSARRRSPSWSSRDRRASPSSRIRSRSGSPRRRTTG